MKTKLFLLVHLLLVSLAFSQEILTVALKKESVIIERIPFKYNLENHKFSLKQYSDNLIEQKVIIDNLIISEFIELSKNQDGKYWTDDELKDRILVDYNKEINFNKAFEKLNPKTKNEIKMLKKEIKEYNSFKNEWKTYPISISRPIYSKDNKYAILAIEQGNNGGNVSLFQKENELWSFVGYITRWAY